MALWVCINVSGLRSVDLAKMGSARREPHKAIGGKHHIFNQAFPSAGSTVMPSISPPQTSRASSHG